MPDNILFEGDFNPNKIVEAIDTVIDKQRELLAQQNKVTETNTASTASEEKLTTEIGKKSASIKKLTDDLESLDAKNRKVWGPAIETRIQKENEALQRLQASYEKVSAAATNLQKTVGKPLAVTLNSNQAVTQIQKLTASIETLRAKMLVKQELLIKETDLNKIRQYNKEIDILGEEMKRIANAGKKGFDEMGNALIKDFGPAIKTTEEKITKAAASTNVLSKSFGFLRTAANLLPGIGLAGIFGLIGEAAFSLGEEIFNTGKKFSGSIPYIDRYNEAVKDAVGGVTGEVVKVETIVKALQTENLTRQERINLVEELKKQNPEYFGQLDVEKSKIGEITEAYRKYSESIINSVEAKLTEKDLTEVVSKRLTLQKELNKVTINGVKQLGDEIVNQYKETGAFVQNVGDRLYRTFGTAKMDFTNEFVTKDRITQIMELLGSEDKLVESAARNITGDVYKKTPKDKKAPEDVYREQLQKLKAKLASINESIFTSEDTIKAKVAEEVKKGNAEYDKLFREGKLTSPELASLKALNSTVGKAELAKEMKSFNEKRKAAQKQIDDELEKLRAEDVDKRIANIKGEFEQEAAVIQMEYEKQKTALIERQKAENEKLVKDRNSGLISDEQLMKASSDLQEAYSKLFSDLDAYVARKQAELSQKSFERSVQGIKDVFAGTFVVSSEETSKKIDALTAKYLQSEVTYKKYQKDLTKILREETAERLKLERLELQSQLDSVNGRLDNPQSGDTADFRKKLKKQQLELRGQLSQNSRNTDANNAGTKDADQQALLQKLNDYVTAYVDIVNPILQFWQTANDAEARSLDRSLAIQQRRVDQAQKIADRGNATYLKSEQDRMNDLQVKQEANARRQMAINAAIQASSALTAVVSGVAKAVITGNPLDAIAAVGSIIAAIGAGYAIVKSLQQNQPSFYEGTEDTGPGGRLDNKGGFHAILHPNERVVPADKNKELRGISNEQLVETVNQHKMLVEHLRTPSLPELNYDRLESAAHFHITHDGKLVAMMEENNSKMEEVNTNILRLNKTMKSIGVSFSMDRNGFMAIALDGFKQEQINKKV